MSRRVSYHGSFSSAYNPVTDTRDLQLYLNQNTATPSSWLDQSTNAFDFTQGVVSRQPDTTDPLKVVFDGNDDQTKIVSNVFISDSGGIMFFSGYRPLDGSSGLYVVSSDRITNNHHLSFAISSSGKLTTQIKSLPLDNIIQSTNTVAAGDYFYGYIKSTGTGYEISLNGVIETIIVDRGSDNGKWYSNIPNRDNISLACIVRTTTDCTKPEINKVIYSNAPLTSLEIDEINTFMSVPSN